MKELIQKYLEEVAAFSSGDAQQIEAFRVKYAGRKGILNDLFEQFKQVPGPEKKETGMLLNSLKESVIKKVEELKARLNEGANEGQMTDLTLPVDFYNTGSRHPLSIVRNRIISIFSRIGFTVAEGPEIEDDWHNFSALNFTPDHPARDMQDTFFIEKRPGGNDVLLRTHTSSVQVRVMESTPAYPYDISGTGLPQRGHLSQGPLHLSPGGGTLC